MRISDWSSDVCSSDLLRRILRDGPYGPPQDEVRVWMLREVSRWARSWSSGTSGRCSRAIRSEEHTSELQSLMRISYAVFCLKKKKITQLRQHILNTTNTTLLIARHTQSNQVMNET